MLQYNIYHDDVIKRKHFPRYWPFVRGIHPSPLDSLHKDQSRGALMFSLICAWTNGNRDAGDLRRHRSHYDITVMTHHFFNLAKAVLQTNHHRLEKIIRRPNILGVIHEKVFLQERLVIQPWKHLWRCSHTRFNALKQEQNSWHFANDIFKCIMLKNKCVFLFEMSLRLLPKAPNDNTSALIRVRFRTIPFHLKNMEQCNATSFTWHSNECFNHRSGPVFYLLT